eukprot:GEMP01086204.1.p3 GENE.GEMP01086204.1~~GEMP01086204.1.p3  ORF type:complete len:100 (+),score=11.08 GEMP01086204.1:83-382(+)
MDTNESTDYFTQIYHSMDTNESTDYFTQIYVYLCRTGFEYVQVARTPSPSEGQYEVLHLDGPGCAQQPSGQTQGWQKPARLLKNPMTQDSWGKRSNSTD